jgi:hypothetical protein
MSLSAPNNKILGHLNADGFIHGCLSTSSKEARAVGFAWSIRRKRSLQPLLGVKQYMCVWAGGMVNKVEMLRARHTQA